MPIRLAPRALAPANLSRQLFSPSTIAATATARWAADQYDAANDRLTDLSGNGLHARLGSIVGADTNDPTRLVYAGEQYAYHPGVVGNYASTPDSAALSITGDIDIRVRVAMDSWTPTSLVVLLAKMASGTQRSYRLDLNTTGTLVMRFSTDGSTEVSPTSSASVSAAAGAVKWVRATRTSGTGTVRFFTSDDGEAWTQLGSDVASSAGAIFDSTSPLEIGSAFGGSGTGALAGKVYRAIVRNGIDGTTVADYNPALATSPFGSFVGAQGNTWTLNRSATGKKLTIVDRTMLLLGTDDYLEVADNDLLDFGASDSFTVAIALRQFSDLDTVRIAKTVGFAASNVGWMLYIPGSAQQGRLRVKDGTTAVEPWTAAIASNGVASLMAGVRNTATDTITNYGGTGGTDTTTATLANAVPVRIGSYSTSVGAPGNFIFTHAAIFRRALTSAELSQLATEWGVA